jgi:hypothetical protein
VPELSKAEAVDRLVKGVENARPDDFAEIYSELFLEKTPPSPLVAGEIIKHIKSGIEEEEIVDLWNVVFPEDWNVWYDEEDKTFRYNQEVLGTACDHVEQPRASLIDEPMAQLHGCAKQL